jgi:hypothetical protein
MWLFTMVTILLPKSICTGHQLCNKVGAPGRTFFHHLPQRPQKSPGKSIKHSAEIHIEWSLAILGLGLECTSQEATSEDDC